MKKKEFLIILLLAILILTAGGVGVWKKKVKPTPSPTPLKTTPISCQTDADCPKIACAQGCSIEGPCPPCPQNI